MWRVIVLPHVCNVAAWVDRVVVPSVNPCLLVVSADSRVQCNAWANVYCSLLNLAVYCASCWAVRCSDTLLDQCVHHWVTVALSGCIGSVTVVVWVSEVVTVWVVCQPTYCEDWQLLATACSHKRCPVKSQRASVELRVQRVNACCKHFAQSLSREGANVVD